MSKPAVNRALAALLLLLCVSSVVGHGYMSVPKSRNKLASERPHGGSRQYCPHW